MIDKKQLTDLLTSSDIEIRKLGLEYYKQMFSSDLEVQYETYPGMNLLSLLEYHILQDSNIYHQACIKAYIDSAYNTLTKYE